MGPVVVVVAVVAARMQLFFVATHRVVRDDGSVVARRPGKGTAITSLALDVADDGSLGHRAHWEDVTDGELRLLTAVHKLSSVEALSSDEGHLLELVPVPSRKQCSGVVVVRRIWAVRAGGACVGACKCKCKCMQAKCCPPTKRLRRVREASLTGHGT